MQHIHTECAYVCVSIQTSYYGFFFSYFVCKKAVWKVCLENNYLFALTHSIADLGGCPGFLPQKLWRSWNEKAQVSTVCSLHSCPQWGRQEMPASSQESLLWWDFPIYFINARRPDTGGDKDSRLQVLIISQSSGPTTMTSFSSRCSAKVSLFPNWKNSPSEEYDQPTLSVLAKKPLQIT